MEILPAIDLRGGKCVRLRQGDYDQETVFGDDPVEMAVRWSDAGATRLHLVDLDAAKVGHPVNHDVVKKIVRAAGIPCQMGGGVRDTDSIRQMLDDVGVDRVIVGTAALKNPEWFSTSVEEFPNRIALGIDARDSMVATEGWLDVSSMSAHALASQYKGLPVAALIYTNIANDGMMQGVDEETIRDMIQLTELGFPVIASGGVTDASDVSRLAEVSAEHPGLVGAIIGRSLYEGRLTVQDAIRLSRDAKAE